ncbi:DsbA family protein [Plantactinospora sp. B24E8]|uniref:DsbA family protein n=1 Tax=Plantactinospora sp. B24E8 TaxID=3153567 RepID=UPI00325DE993
MLRRQGSLHKALAAFPHRTRVEVVHRSFELDPRLTQTHRTTSAAHAKKYGMTPAQARAAEENIAGIARKEGLGYLVDFRDDGNTFDLHRLLHLAASEGVEDNLLTLFYEGNFAAERSIYDPEHQVGLAVRAWRERQPELTILGADDQTGCDADGACALPGADGTTVRSGTH